jgi:hypothetical protein
MQGKWLGYAAAGFVALILAGCSDGDCKKRLAEVANQGNTYTAVLEVDGCGGATVGYITDLKLSRVSGSRIEETKYIWSTKGWVNADLKWVKSDRLEVHYPASVEDQDVVLQLPYWSGLEIVYKSDKK